ncbi:MAG TPA: NrpR regulatory domain-containing protein, partial [Dehalococcoidia bacterium]|nr:NrpR regulatory domain-containing protein [Dehalococcoidia bacterium]
QVRRAAAEGNGRILANFRETPSACRPIVEKIGAQLREVGIGGILMMGESSEPVCQIPVGLNKNGMVLLGGMNPIAAAEEAGIEAENVSESGTIDFRHLVRIRDV